MKRIVFGVDAIAKLPKGEIVAFCDGSGRVLGQFRPALVDDRSAHPQGGTRIILDASVIAELPECDIVDICDESGRVQGRFRPAIYDDPAAQPRVSEEELRRRSKEGGGRPLADILADLDKLA